MNEHKKSFLSKMIYIKMKNNNNLKRRKPNIYESLHPATVTVQKHHFSLFYPRGTFLDNNMNQVRYSCTDIPRIARRCCDESEWLIRQTDSS